MYLIINLVIFLVLVAYVFNAIVLISLYLFEREAFLKGQLTEEQYIGFIIAILIAIIPIANIWLMYFIIREYINYYIEKYNLLKGGLK